MSRPGSLVILDIDGTLTRSMTLDVHCYRDAVRDIVGVEVEALDGYRYVTDSGVLSETVERAGRLPLSAEETGRVKSRFIELLDEVFARSPRACTAVPGAQGLLATLRGAADLHVALATGAWRASADRKLAWAGLDVGGIPMVTSDDAPTREAIVREAAARSGGEHLPCVSVGDGPWDARTARRLGVGFLGVAACGSGAVLRQAGAGRIIRDYRDVPGCVALLRSLAR